MIKAVYMITLLVAAALVSFMYHIWNNPELPKKNRMLFVASSMLVILNLVLEDVFLMIDGNTDNITAYYIFLIIDGLASIWIIPVQMLGFGFEAEGKIISVLSAAFSVFIIAAAPWKLLYYVSEDGVYTPGVLASVGTIWTVASTLVSILLLVGLAIKFKRVEMLTLVLVGLIEISGIVFSSILNVDMIRTIGFALAFMLVYSYHDDLTAWKLHESLRESNEKNRELSLQMVNALVSAVDAKDRYTNGHSRRVAEYAVLLAEKLGWDRDRLYDLKCEALMHDVGKIGIPDVVLNKQGKLNNAEFGIIKSHTVFGSDILTDMENLPDAGKAARWHHERYDGKGYPDRICGNDIPDFARIISIADTFDAMNSDRIYRRALPKDVIIRELKNGKGTQFDPDYADAFIELFESGALDEIAKSGKHDLAEKQDDFTEEMQDFFQMFHDARDARGSWEDNYEKTALIHKHLTSMAQSYDTEIDIAVVKISTKEGTELSDPEMDSAVDVMEKSIGDSVDGLVVCGRVSRTQVVAISRKAEGRDLGNMLQLAVVYYYKVFKTDKLDISFEVIGEG